MMLGADEENFSRSSGEPYIVTFNRQAAVPNDNVKTSTEVCDYAPAFTCR